MVGAFDFLLMKEQNLINQETKQEGDYDLLDQLYSVGVKIGQMLDSLPLIHFRFFSRYCQK
ncbi:hypothetical protein JW930_01185 [Candidatus Woesearchaeota archaeon]|nr:hypothetical protein [Candidatus Woesearchaeota archaeon]